MYPYSCFRIGPIPNAKGHWVWKDTPAMELSNKIFLLTKIGEMKVKNFSVLRDSGSYPVEQSAWVVVNFNE